MKMQQRAQWKDVQLDEHLAAKGVAKGLVGIEELGSYNIVRGSVKKKSKIDITNKKSKKLKKKKKHQEQLLNDSVVKLDSQKLKKKRKRKLPNNDSNSDPPQKKKIRPSYTSSGKSKEKFNDAKSKSGIEMWNDLFVPAPVLEALSRLGYSTPTPIQALTLPSAIRDRLDIIGAAETGSGKTLAFGIPIIHSILRAREEGDNSENDGESDNSDSEEHAPVQDEDALSIEEEDVEESDDDGDEDDDNLESDDGIGCVKVLDDVELPWEADELNQDDTHSSVKALILTPTRELAIQVKNHIVDVTVNTDIKLSVIVGGMSLEKQRRVLKKNPDVVVATPGRLWELIQEGNTQACGIRNIQSLVIDEADRMVEKGHFAELTNILNYINSSGKKRQTFVFSATLTLIHEAPRRDKMKKRKVKLTAEQKLQSLVELVGMKKNPKVIDITRKVGTVDTLTEAKINCDLDEKDYYIYYFLRQFPGRTLVFCNSVDCVRRLTSLLTLLQCSPLPLHASMHQKQRLKNLERFTADDKGLLLATDVAARGLDIPEIEHVIHFQVPRTSETYVHRSGRTARASREGISVVLIEPQEINNYRRMCRTLNRDEELPTFPIDTEVMPSIKELVNLAREVDKCEHRIRKVASKNNWIQRAAEQMDLEISDDELYDEGDEEQQAKMRRNIKSLRKQINSRIKKPLSASQFLGKYPTMSGKLPSSSKKFNEKAVTALKSDEASTIAMINKKKKRKRKK